MLDFTITFFITFFNIAILYFILRKLLFKPITKFMQDRSLKIRNEQELASRERSRADELRVMYEGMLRNAEEEADQILAEARETGMRQAETIIERGRAEAEGLIAAAQERIELESRKASASIKAEAVSLAVVAASRILRRQVNADDAGRAVADFLADLESGDGQAF
jgi:F-type H+-transporting ATPase subunit b